MEYTALIPNGRGQEYLNQTLVSILTQTKKPQEIIIFDDSKERHFDKSILNMMDYIGIRCRIIRDPEVKSMYAIRKTLIDAANPIYPLCFFVDDDMVLDAMAAQKLIQFFTDSSKKKSLAFVQGLRIEVGGRLNNSPDDINQVREDTKPGSPIYYGDTAILMFNLRTFKSDVPWGLLTPILNKPGLGGSDVVITMSLIEKGYSGVAQPHALGYHFAEAHFSYWSSFLMADHYVQKTILGIVSQATLDKVYNKLG